MARRIVYSLIPAAVMLFAGGAALGQGMKTFKIEQAAQRQCPADTIVWLSTASASHHYKGDPWYGRTQTRHLLASLRFSVTKIAVEQLNVATGGLLIGIGV